jgi:hypothetical protein
MKILYMSVNHLPFYSFENSILNNIQIMYISNHCDKKYPAGFNLEFGVHSRTENANPSRAPVIYHSGVSWEFVLSKLSFCFTFWFER